MVEIPHGVASRGNNQRHRRDKHDGQSVAAHHHHFDNELKDRKDSHQVSAAEVEAQKSSGKAQPYKGANYSLDAALKCAGPIQTLMKHKDRRSDHPIGAFKTHCDADHAGKSGG